MTKISRFKINKTFKICKAIQNQEQTFKLVFTKLTQIVKPYKLVFTKLVQTSHTKTGAIFKISVYKASINHETIQNQEQV